MAHTAVAVTSPPNAVVTYLLVQVPCFVNHSRQGAAPSKAFCHPVSKFAQTVPALRDKVPHL